VKRSRVAILAISALFLLGLLVWPAVVLAETEERVSVDTTGSDANDASYAGSISADGRYVAFTSDANDLVSPDKNDVRDIFIRDLTADTTQLVSVDSNEIQGNDHSYSCSITPDGRYVAFSSLATNLVEGGDSNGVMDIFVRDLIEGATLRVNVSLDGTHAKYGPSGLPSITTDDEFVYVAYGSSATNLVEDDSNDKDDIFVSYFEKLKSQDISTRRVSVRTDGTEAIDHSFGPSIAVDGANVYVAYASQASNLVAGDGNTASDVFVSSLDKSNLVDGDVVTQRVSVKSGGDESGGGGEWGLVYNRPVSISADGRYVAFRSCATDLVSGDTNGAQDVFVTDWNKSDPTGIVTERVSVATDGSEGEYDSAWPSISGDGRYVAFESFAENFTEDDQLGYRDIFVRDLMDDTTALLSTNSEGEEANNASHAPSITPSAGNLAPVVVFESRATNLVTGATDGNGANDVFVAGVRTAPKVPAGTRKPAKAERYEQTDTLLLYQGGWGVQEDGAHSGGSIYYSDDPEAALTITFKGNRVDWIAAVGPQMGKMWVSVDGGEPVLVDLYSETELAQHAVWSTGTLNYGVHVIKVYLTNGASGPVSIDALDVYGELF
jgi:Tol biopolymer transport system component